MFFMLFFNIFCKNTDFFEKTYPGVSRRLITSFFATQGDTTEEKPFFRQKTPPNRSKKFL